MKSLPSFRLIDGVVIGAVGLLALKVLGFLAGPPAGDAAEPNFGRVLTHARTNYVPADPVTTGSTSGKTQEPPAPAAPEPPAMPAAPAPPLVAPSATEKVLLDRLGERREELQQRNREMEAREKLLQEQERKLDEQAREKKAREEASRTTAASAKADAETSALKGLVVMYETMKPKEAARVFDRLPLDILMPVATAMKPQKMAEVLAAMTPEAAEKLTVAMARKARVTEKPTPASLPPGELSAIELPKR